MVEPALALVVQGAKRTVLADREFRYGAGDYLVASVGLPVTGAITRATLSEPFLVLVLHLDPATIAALVLQTAPEPAAPASDCGLAVSRAGPAMLDAATRLVELLDHPRDAAALAPLYERELLWRLLTGEQGAMVRQIGLAGSHLNHLGHAIGWLRAHYREPMRIDELAALSAMSPRTFHRHFRAMTRMTPLDYQKRLRLNEARAPAHRRSPRRRRRRVRGRLRQPIAIQPRIPPHVRRTAQPRRLRNPRAQPGAGRAQIQIGAPGREAAGAVGARPRPWGRDRSASPPLSRHPRSALTPLPLRQAA
jgi:AraC-like DNA-binding protein